MKCPTNVTIKEVGPRDGLQNEPTFIETEDKIKWINMLSESGFSYIEITSFVHPKWIPALADAVQVAKEIKRKPDVTYAALVPNAKGLERALAAEVDEVSVFMSASETHNKKNINKSIDETFVILDEVIQEAQKANKTTRGYVSTVFGCPYEHEVSIEKVIRVADTLFESGIHELSLGDTVGVANPVQVESVIETLLKRYPSDKLALHFHDTRGVALTNIYVALTMGITTFDGAVGGLGGCPYAPGAAGNVTTEDLIYMLHGMEIETGVNEQRLLEAAMWIEDRIGKSLPSKNLRAFKGKKSM
ncbi:hydroxymethylglutaryl-CoA lyase [Alkalihalobacillus sp. LMS39]|uniref:hydroxymethylglutaryl-CoA lyase n=1 Tax=Alkalihalobacillus sp. LMS39 TaxID=2924032 RepID=UPI001FB1DEDE|nr:hydroxymethylglutaryl-CoA lyase [Alkalihalobacillus sp. LMS39]UOE96499.1 hydroxymethylglutaryl-CoA lyase [Alkalihalobacillus sp. LMS39]